MQIEHTQEKFIDLKTLGNILLIKGLQGITKWCEDHKIPIQILGKKRVAYRFLVEMELDKKLLQDLKNKYPNKWEELYRCYQDNDRLGYLLLIDDEPALDFRPVARQTRPKSQLSQAFADS